MRPLRSLLVKALPLLPRSLVERVASRYVAGSGRGDVLEVVEQLSRRGLRTTVDLLGEDTDEPAEVEAVVEEYRALAGDLAARSLCPALSVKLTHLGLRRDEEGARRRVARILDRVEELGGSLRIDMEDSSTTDAALRAYRALREAGHPSIGIAIQAYLRRSERDVERLLDLEPDVRICKGIYREPPAIAWQRRGEIRASYRRLVRRVVEGGGKVAIATHDRRLIDGALAFVAELGLGPERHVFEMLLGVGRSLRPRIRAAGSPIRIYCPYGPDWYDYSLRRLRENPKIAGYIVTQLLGRGEDR